MVSFLKNDTPAHNKKRKNNQKKAMFVQKNVGSSIKFVRKNVVLILKFVRKNVSLQAESK